jgi:hypothetical protein
MTGQAWHYTNPVRLQNAVSRVNGKVAGESGAIQSATPLDLGASAHGVLTLTQRVLRLLEARGYVVLVFAILIGSCSLPVRAQQFTELPNAPSFNKKLFIAELSAYTAINVVDGITTAQSVREGNVEGGFPGGSSYLLGQRPSVVRYFLTMGLLETGISFTAYRMQHSNNKWLRVAGHGLMIQAAYGHTDGVIRNIRLLQSR